MSESKTKEHGLIEEVFETVLFNSRFFILTAVLGILVAAFIMFIKGCLEVIQGVQAFLPFMSVIQPNFHDDNSIILSFIPAIDNYLFAAILLITSMGLYELFISKIDPKSRRDETKPDWLVIKDIDDLKGKIGEVVIMILIVNFFKLSFSVVYDQPLDLLVLGGAILLVSISLVATHYLTVIHRVSHPTSKKSNNLDESS
jgi:uncharacterized protein (TIGR00645 family)